MVKVNFTIEFETQKHQLDFELLLRQYKIDVKDLKVLPDTTELYETNEHFRSLCKSKKKSDEEYRNFLNKL